MKKIERTLITPPVRRKGDTMVALLALAVGITIIGIPFAVIIMSVGPRMIGNAMERSTKERAREALAKFAGGKPDHLDVDWAATPKGDWTGTGMALRDGRIFMLDHGEAAEIPWESIRSWTWRKQGYDRMTVVGGGMGDQMAASLQAQRINSQSAFDARLDSGFFVTVKDVGKPEWQFMTDDVAVLKKWDAIFHAIDDEKSAAKPAA